MKIEKYSFKEAKSGKKKLKEASLVYNPSDVEDMMFAISNLIPILFKRIPSPNARLVTLTSAIVNGIKQSAKGEVNKAWLNQYITKLIYFLKNSLKNDETPDETGEGLGDD